MITVFVVAFVYMATSFVLLHKRKRRECLRLKQE